VLPESVVQRVKSPYPQTQDAQYPAALQQQAKERLARPGHPVFELVSHDWLTSAVQADPVAIPMRVRNGLERAPGPGHVAGHLPAGPPAALSQAQVP
jgi:asparagine synthase (glutamine-hydrolysing)